jgi:hypothetical protein
MGPFTRHRYHVDLGTYQPGSIESWSEFDSNAEGDDCSHEVVQRLVQKMSQLLLFVEGLQRASNIDAW